MKKLSKKESVAVFIALALLAYLLFSGPIVSLFSPQSQEINNKQMIQTGFQAKDVIVGTGSLAERGDYITAHYVGQLENGRVFDSSRDRNTPISFTLGTGQVIKGWDEGLIGMRVGGKRVLTIAPDYGYGSRPVGAIPANSVLIFEVELIDANKPTQDSSR